VPSLTFYAVNDDQKTVLGSIFDSGSCRVFEAYSVPDMPLREFHNVGEVSIDQHGTMLALHVIGAGPDPTISRIDLRPGAIGDATFRYRCDGWGLIWLNFGSLFQDTELRSSDTSHNTAARAAKWAGTLRDLGDPNAWQWPAITKASRHLNSKIRASAIREIGPRPVLPRAAELIDARGLKYEAGTGLRADPMPV
jgi:hypothetical protein